MFEAETASETSVNLRQSTRRYKPEDSHLHTPRRENLIFYSDIMNFSGKGVFIRVDKAA
jgi:hypothetical protein